MLLYGPSESLAGIPAAPAAVGSLLLPGCCLPWKSRAYWAWRILEGKHGIVADLRQQTQRLLKILVCLAGKSDDDIRRQADRTPRRLNPANALQIPLPRIFALHPLQHAEDPLCTGR